MRQSAGFKPASPLAGETVVRSQVLIPIQPRRILAVQKGWIILLSENPSRHRFSKIHICSVVNPLCYVMLFIYLMICQIFFLLNVIFRGYPYLSRNCLIFLNIMCIIVYRHEYSRHLIRETYAPTGTRVMFFVRF